MGELDGKVAVITGAGSGMARATSKVFVREGAKVFGADISGRGWLPVARSNLAFRPSESNERYRTCRGKPRVLG